ncbi:MAG TPA: hypothetical protein PLB89_14200 [Flavobacteriales bacterium]|nr:hypothetical protein [Flavobacteriales bacterium]
MRIVLSLILVILGALLALPLLRIANMLASSGTSDASAVSTSSGLLIQGGIGILLTIAGLVLFIARIIRRGTARTA